MNSVSYHILLTYIKKSHTFSGVVMCGDSKGHVLNCEVCVTDKTETNVFSKKEKIFL